jgi:hypothetical protein
MLHSHPQKLTDRIGKTLAALSLLLATPMLSAPAIAQPYEGRFRGNSASWRPDYVGTLQLQQTGAYSYTATADVELRRLPSTFADATAFTYEMRGEITLTSPVTINTGDKVFNCTAAGPAPVRISGSRMAIYTGDEEYPRNTYELRVYQTVLLPNCVSQTGERINNPNLFVEVNFDSSAMVLAARPPSNETIPEVTLTPEEQARAEQQRQSAEAMYNNPAFQRVMQQMQERAQSGRPITQAEALAFAEQLRRSGALPSGDQQPVFSPERQAEFDRQSARLRSDYSHLRRFTNINQLQDQMSVTHAGQTRTFSWNLRRVNTPN